MQDDITLGLAKKFGLNDQAVVGLSPEEILSYICFYTPKYHNKLSVLFVGFLQSDIEELNKTASKYDLTIYKRLTPNVKIVCVSDTVHSTIISSAKTNGSIVVTRTEFNSIFKERTDGYDLFKSRVLFDDSIPENFRIPKPLSNFHESTDIKSFSFESDKTYSVNLLQMTCTCPDFVKKRQDFKIGDIRRMCKHLMLDYGNRFGLAGLSDFNSYVVLNCLPIKGTFFDVSIETTNQKAFVNYWDIDDWWDVFLKNKKGEWTCYKYVPHENDFAYGDKPMGVVVILKKKLHSFYQWNRKRDKSRGRQESQRGVGTTTRDMRNRQDGCATVLLLIFLIFFLVGAALIGN